MDYNNPSNHDKMAAKLTLADQQIEIQRKIIKAGNTRIKELEKEIKRLREEAQLLLGNCDIKEL